MNFTKMFILTVIFLVILVGCAETRIVKHPLQQTASGKVSVTNSVIYADGKPYAEIKCHFPSETKENKESYLKQGYFKACRGLSIYYIAEKNEAWIFPKEGIPPEKIWKEHYTTTSKSEAIFAWAYDINVSEDGRVIRYKRPGLIWNSEKVFQVESESSE
jgi:hypothetical protein